MLTPVQRRSRRARKATFVIVASEYNRRYVDSMVRAATAVLRRAGGVARVVRVPGAYEIPLVASRIARLHREGAGGSPPAPAGFAIICLGVILRGETVHAAHIGEAVSSALMRIQLRYEVPLIHEVLLLENHAQAKVRCLDRRHNRGAEAAQTALAMAAVLASVDGSP
ncbi:MAG TPA: 6,7-dimethyl-8-ribityllumazine synthase [Verrucomicrobiae bacterium]